MSDPSNRTPRRVVPENNERGASERARDEVAAELESHFEGTVELLVRRGWSEDEAREEAHRRFGDLRRYQAVLVRMERRRFRMRRTAAAFRAVASTVRHGLRDVRRAPGFSAAVVATLALGIGANAATFRVVDSLLLSPPPYVERPSEVRRLFQTFVPDGGEAITIEGAITLDMFTYAEASAIRASGLPVSIAAWYGGGDYAILGEAESARRVRAARVDSAFFPLLGVRPLLGRGLLPEDHRPDAPAVALLGHALWREAFAGDTAVVGSTVRAGEQRFEVVGVLPPGFVGPHAPATDLWLPLEGGGLFPPGWRDNPTLNVFHVLARIPPDIAEERVIAEAEAIVRRHRSEHGLGGVRGELGALLTSSLVPGDHPDPGATVAGAVAMTRWLMAVSLLVLLVACANVANLFLARGERLGRETAVRMMLGAGKARLGGEIMARSLVLSGLGACGAAAVAVWGGAALEQAFLTEVGLTAELKSGRTFAFALGVAGLAAVLAGGVPALAASGSNVRAGMEGGRRVGRAGGGLRRGLLAVQTALSAVLLVGASLFVLSFRGALGKDVGFDPESLVRVTWTTDFEAAAARFGMSGSLLRDEVEALAASHPGVRSTVLVQVAPFPRVGPRARVISTDDPEAGPPVEMLGLDVHAVGAGFLGTLGVRPARGRDLEPADFGPGAEPVVVVSQRIATRLWPGADPLTRCLEVEGVTSGCARVVGVAAGHATRLAEWPEFQVWLPRSLASPTSTLLVRVEGDPYAAAQSLRRELASLPRLRHVEVTPMRDVVRDEMRSWRLGASVFSLFGVIALGVAGVGLYGLLSYEVARRRREIGIRIALGARRGRVARHVLARAGLTVGAGLAGGLAFSVWGARRLEPLLFETSASDPTVFALAAGTLLAIGALAASLPTWRATRVEPRESLAAE